MSMLSARFRQERSGTVDLPCRKGQRRCEVAGLESPYPAAIPPFVRVHCPSAPHTALATGVNVKGSCLWGGRGKTTEFKLNCLGTEDEYAVFVHRYPQASKFTRGSRRTPRLSFRRCAGCSNIRRIR